jgi:hypothetical protein
MSDVKRPAVGKQGLQGVAPVFSDDSLLVREWKLSQSDRLHKYSEQRSFFTDVAIARNPWGLKIPIWEAFASETGILSEVWLYTTPRQVFSTGDLNFDHTVFAMDTEVFEKFKQVAGTLAIWDEDKKIGARVRWQDTHIVDPSLNEGEIATIPVVLFCLETTVGSCLFRGTLLGDQAPVLEHNRNLIYPETVRFFNNWIDGRGVYS